MSSLAKISFFAVFTEGERTQDVKVTFSPGSGYFTFALGQLFIWVHKPRFCESIESKCKGIWSFWITI